ncbi:MAG: MFS transporter [Anaerolineae bacterium]|nr:MFS transporter [Anaerolineae bacterium]
MNIANPNIHSAPLWRIIFRPASPAERNQRNVVIDAIGVGITAGVGSFLSVFLVRLGASNFQVGLLTAMPALTGMVLAIPIGEFLSRRPNIVPWFATSRFFVLSCYLLTGLAPFLVGGQAPAAIIAIWALATLPQTLVSVAFTVVMGAVAGPGGRMTLMSRRWSILGLTNTVTVLIVGQLLNLFDFPLNYQVVFIGSTVGALISFIFSSSIKLPSVTVPTTEQSFLATLRQHSRMLRANRRFVNFTVSQFVFRWGLALAIPLFPIFWVRNLHASDQMVSVINSTTTFVTMIAYFVWARVSQRHGSRPVLLIASLGICFYPLLTALTPRPEILPLWAGMAGLFSAGIELVFFDVLVGTCPPDQQAAYVGIYQTTVYIATFLAPLLGTTLSDLIGIVPVLILATVIRLIGFGMIARLGVGQA